jgi:hypothetical protein
MKNTFMSLVLLIFVLAAANAQGQNDEVIVYRLPEPRRVYIYRENNRAIFETSIPTAYIVNKSFVLPEKADLESLTIYQDGKRIHNFTTFITETAVVFRRGEIPRQVKVLQVNLPDIKPAMPLEVSYGVLYGSGEDELSWNFVLDLEIMNNNTLNCALLVRVNTVTLPETDRAILAKEPEIILTSADNSLLEDATVLLKLGKMNIATNTQQLIKIEEGSSNYNIVYRWEANYREPPFAYLRAQTPIKTMANKVRLNIRSGGRFSFLPSERNRYGSYNDNINLNISPNQPFDIRIGEQPNIVTYRSLVMTEFPAAEYPQRRLLPFTHALEYSVENRSERPIDLEIVIPTAIGRNHRTEYTFTTREPDDRPGGNMLWKYAVSPGEKIVLQFSYDADFKNDSSLSYREFDYYEGGR